MGKNKADLLQGTLDVMVLKTLSHGPLHGYGIAQKILLASRRIVDVQQGSLYPALHRLERKGLVASEWREGESGRMAKYYALTKAGRKQLEDEVEQWSRYSSAVNWVLEG
ncbi:MAG: PadR family transcriptional regulator [Bryobacteraceae bacterium]